MKSLKNLFKPEDFSYTENEISNRISDLAQQVLNKFIEENGVKVYGIELSGEHKTMKTYKQRSDTHSAILLNIQPLKQCEHKEAVYVEDQDKTWFKCRDCGKPVKAKGWEGV